MPGARLYDFTYGGRRGDGAAQAVSISVIH